MNTILIILSCTATLLAVLSIVLNIVNYRRVKNYLSDTKTRKGFESHGNIRDEIIEVVLGSSRIIDKLPKQQIIKETTKQPDKISTETLNYIVDTVLAKLSKNQVKEECDEKKELNTELKYADAYNSSTCSFYSIDKYPKDSTIYEFSINKATGEGTYTLYKKAYTMVSECRDYLEGACEVTGFGMTIKIMSVGKILFEDNRYSIVKPLEIRFE